MNTTRKPKPEVPSHIIVDGLPCEDGGSDEDLRLARQLVFGELHRLAAPVVEHYHSDFYRDAEWMQKHLPDTLGKDGAMTFYFGCRDTGTSIGCDLELVAYGNDHLYRVDLTCTDRHGSGRFLRHCMTITGGCEPREDADAST